MKSNIIYRKINIEIATGATNFNESISLPEGTCLGVHVIPIKNKEPEHLVELGIQNAQSGDVVSATDYRDCIHKGGGYFDGVKQLNFPTDNNRFFVNVHASEAVASDFLAQLIFIIEIDE